MRGDTRTVGMAGATTGLADTFIASVDNPSGLAMTDDVGDDTFTSNNVNDGEVQNFQNAMTSNFVGFAVAPYPWGLGFGVISTQEGQPYTIPDAPTSAPVSLQIVTREAQLSASRVFLNDRLGIGATLRLGQAEEDADLGNNPLTAAFHSYAVGATVGAMWQFPRRWLLGVSYQTSMRYSVNATSVPTTVPPGFFQPVFTPSRTSFGIGWIPNWFFRASAQATLIGSTPDTALLSNEDIPVGVNAVWSPRIGASYIFCDYKEIRGTVFAGSYYEFTQVQGESNRLHGTAGVELKPWIFTVGTGVDSAHDYRNVLVSLSVDIFKVMAKLDFIPTPWHPRYTGFFHDPFTNSDENLARPLVRDWRSHGPELDPFDIGLNIPSKISEKAQEVVKSVTGVEPEPTPSPEASPKAKAKPKAHKKKKKKKKSTPKPGPD